MSTLVQRFISDKFVAGVIALDFIAIFAMGFPQLDGHTRDLLAAVDALCLCFFVCEAALKLKTFGWSAYWSDGLNRLDFLVLLMAAPSVLVPVMGVNLVVLRLIRYFRLIRALRFIPNIDHLWLGARRALKASVGVCVGLTIYALLLGALASQLFGVVAPALFGDPLTATYTMFQVFTIEGWHEVPQAVIAGMGADPMQIFGVRAFFVLSVITGGVIGLGLTNAVFVDEMMMDNNDPLERKIDALTAEVGLLRQALKNQSPSDEDT